jgi:hypothetical protein
MKKLLFLLLLISSFAYSQQKAFYSHPYAVLIDTTTREIKYFEKGTGLNYYSLYHRSTRKKLFDCFDGGVFCFVDTLSTSDIVQQGSTGVFKITPHLLPVSTVKKNILAGAALLQYDSTVFELAYSPFSDSNYPLTIRNKSTGIEYVRILSKTDIFFNVIPPLSSISAFGTGTGIKKIVIQ